jgi:hypothetical protein
LTVCESLGKNFTGTVFTPHKEKKRRGRRRRGGEGEEEEGKEERKRREEEEEEPQKQNPTANHPWGLWVGADGP